MNACFKFSVLACAGALFLAACGSDSSTDSKPEDQKPEKDVCEEALSSYEDVYWSSNISDYTIAKEKICERATAFLKDYGGTCVDVNYNSEKKRFDVSILDGGKIKNIYAAIFGCNFNFKSEAAYATILSDMGYYTFDNCFCKELDNGKIQFSTSTQKILFPDYKGDLSSSSSKAESSSSNGLTEPNILFEKLKVEIDGHEVKFNGIVSADDEDFKIYNIHFDLTEPENHLILVSAQYEKPELPVKTIDFEKIKLRVDLDDEDFNHQCGDFKLHARVSVTDGKIEYTQYKQIDFERPESFCAEESSSSSETSSSSEMASSSSIAPGENDPVKAASWPIECPESEDSETDLSAYDVAYEFNDPEDLGKDILGGYNAVFGVGKPDGDCSSLILDGHSGLRIPFNNVFQNTAFILESRFMATDRSEMGNIIVAEPPGAGIDGWQLRVDAIGEKNIVRFHARDAGIDFRNWSVVDIAEIELDTWVTVRIKFVPTKNMNGEIVSYTLNIALDGSLVKAVEFKGDLGQLDPLYDLAIGYDAMHQSAYEDKFFTGKIDFIRYGAVPLTNE
ncbi:MAG: hypothetical protein HUK20_12000 [Fibrobacter sp.]|nr:hypothetical protein [Fibrobacter sp.]